MFRRSRSQEDVQRLHAAANGGTLDDFLAVYSPSDATADDLGTPLLFDALANNDLAARVAIAHRLLDDGADAGVQQADGTTTLHVLLGKGDHDFEAEPALLERLIDGGADVNASVPRFGTPLLALARQFKFSDARLTPLYDVLLARPELDPLAPGLDDEPVLTVVRKWAAKRADLVTRLEALLVERGTPVPPAD